jgi:two-component system cell cycle response regulator
MSTEILIIEDNPTNMELMAYLLKAFGYGITTTNNGSAGLEAARANPPDLFICDLEMPGLSGFDVLKEIRARPETCRLPVIAVTASAMVGDRDKALAAGFDGYISKPIDPESFVKEVEVFLQSEKRAAPIPEIPNSTEVADQPQEERGALVLVVDDSPVNLALIKSTLVPSGYRVVATESVEAAMKLTRHYAFDLILSDLHMAPESGLEFLRRAKANANLQFIPFLILTSSRTDPSDDVQRLAMEAGAHRFLSRPIVPEHLLEEVAACLKSRNEETGAKKRASAKE